MEIEWKKEIDSTLVETDLALEAIVHFIETMTNTDTAGSEERAGSLLGTG